MAWDEPRRQVRSQFAQCGETYDIPISWGFAPSCFFMAFVPMSLSTSSDFEVATMASWFPGPPRGDVDDIDSFLLRFAVAAGIFVLVLWFGYLAR